MLAELPSDLDILRAELEAGDGSSKGIKAGRKSKKHSLRGTAASPHQGPSQSGSQLPSASRPGPAKDQQVGTAAMETSESSDDESAALPQAPEEGADLYHTHRSETGLSHCEL